MNPGLPNKPRVSVIMGAYNARNYIEEAVRSVLAQTFADLEFIIIDDGSSDGSLAVLQKLAGEDARIVLTTRPNRGIAATGNELLAMARGEFVAIMDHDDRTPPDCLQRLVAHMDATPDCVAACGVRTNIDSLGKAIATQRCVATRVTFPKNEIPLDLPIFLHPSSLMRTTALRSIGGYREILPKAIDYDMWLRLSEKGAFDQLPFVSLEYRWHGSNETAVNGWENFSSALVWHMAALLRARGLPDVGFIAEWNSDRDLLARAQDCEVRTGDDRVVDDVLAAAARASCVPDGPQWQKIRAEMTGQMWRRALVRPWRLRRWRHLGALAMFRAKLALRRTLDGRPALLSMVRAASTRLRNRW